MSVMKPHITHGIASDYATLMAGPCSFYYGYEFGRTQEDEEVWGFRYKREGAVVLEISYEEMTKYPGCPGQFHVAECLLFGIGILCTNKKDLPEKEVESK